MSLRIRVLNILNPTPVTPRQPTRLTTTNVVEINRREYGVIPVWEQLAADQTDPQQIGPRQVLIPYDCLLISVAFVVLCRVGCLWVTGVNPACTNMQS